MPPRPRPVGRATAAAPLAIMILTRPELTKVMVSFQRGIPGEFLPLAQTLVVHRACPPLVMEAFGAWFSSHTFDAFQRFCEVGLHLITDAVMDQVAAMGHLPALVLLHDLGVACTVRAMNLAAKGGHLSVVEFLHSHRREGATDSAMNWAAENGHFNVVTFLHCHRREGCTKSAMTRAAKAGHLNIVKFLHAHRTEGGFRDMLHGAVAGGHVPVVAFLTSNRPLEPCSPAAMDEAAGQGNLEMVRYLHTNRSEGCTTKALVGAAVGGHGHVVAFLMDNLPRHLVRPDLALTAAAAAGNLPMVAMLSPHVESKACREGVAAAAKHKHMDVLAWFVRERRDVVERVRRNLYIQGHANAATLAQLLHESKDIVSHRMS